MSYRVCRDMQEFNWFSPLLQECDDMKGLEINTYMTGELNLVRTHCRGCVETGELICGRRRVLGNSLLGQVSGE